MSEIQAWHNEALGAKAVEALGKNNFKASYVKTRQEAVDKVLSLIPADASVGFGGSWTTQNELGLHTTLEKRGNTIYNHGVPGLTPEESLAIRRKQLTCDVFLTGTNAITLDGKLVNVDGSGNRVAAMIFGPKKVVIVAGVNKIVRDVDAAEERIALHAAPMNNKRLNKAHPCTAAGICMDCQSPSRICNVTTIIRKSMPATDMHIIIVGEELGF